MRGSESCGMLWQFHSWIQARNQGPACPSSSFLVPFPAARSNMSHVLLFCSLAALPALLELAVSHNHPGRSTEGLRLCGLGTGPERWCFELVPRKTTGPPGLPCTRAQVCTPHMFRRCRHPFPQNRRGAERLVRET